MYFFRHELDEVDISARPALAVDDRPVGASAVTGC
jgi:hypothetical protein